MLLLFVCFLLINVFRFFCFYINLSYWDINMSNVSHPRKDHRACDMLSLLGVQVRNWSFLFSSYSTLCESFFAVLVTERLFYQCTVCFSNSSHTCTVFLRCPSGRRELSILILCHFDLFQNYYIVFTSFANWSSWNFSTFNITLK